MLLKLSALKFPNLLRRGLNSPARFLSAHALPDFDANVRFLRNNLNSNTLIQILDQTQDLRSALNIFKWASLQKTFTHDADTYSHIIFRLGLAGNVKELDHFCLRFATDKNCSGSDQALASLVHSFVSHSRLSEAIRVLVNMTLAGYSPSINVFNDLLHAIAKERKFDFQHALFVYKEMVKAGVVPTIDTLNSLLEILFETNRVELGLDQFRKIRNKGISPNVRTFEIVIKGLILNGRVDDAVLMLYEMLELECQPDLSFYTCIVPLFSQENKLQEGIKLYRLMRASNIVPDSQICRHLVHCLCTNHYLDDATSILEEMIEIGETTPVESFVDIVNGFCEGERYVEAIHFLENTCGDLTSPNNALLEGFCKAGNFFLGKTLLVKMSKRGIADCDSWNILIRWICENVGISKAYELLGRMIVHSVLPDSGTYAALVVGNCKLNKYEEALGLFYYIQSKFWVLDSLCYSRLVEGLCRLEKIKKAVEVYYYMSKNRCLIEVTTFNMLIKAVCDVGNMSEAVKLKSLAYYCGNSCTSLTYTTIMLALQKSERAKDVLVMFSQMLIAGCTINTEVFCILIRCMCGLKRFKDCALIFKLMLNKGLVPDSGTMHNLFSCLSNHSQLHLVSKNIDEFIYGRIILDSSTFNILINGFWKEGFKDKACLLVDLMLERGWVPDAATHALLIGSNVKEVTSTGPAMYKNSLEHDNVSNILAEGLGNG